uniref:EGF-like domain-containing protein n=1 Tax=Pavo cristatus TaxID=9049 RepID=A0A8C9LEK1_PAVCR
MSVDLCNLTAALLEVLRLVSFCQFCTEDVDECQLQPNACQNGGTCTNHNGGYACVCVNGWSGDDCSKNIDDCFTASCANGSTCIDRVASFSCICPEGKAGKDGKPLGKALPHVLIFLAANSNPCEHAGKCVNTEGSFHCECLKGYTGPRCEMDINECHSNPCQNDATCLDKIGGFTCLYVYMMFLDKTVGFLYFSS